MRPELVFATIQQQADALRAGEVTSTELVQGYIERIRATDHALRSFVTVAEEQALAAAAEADAALRDGRADSLLTGIPLAVKDNINVAGMPLTNNSRVMEDYVPTTDAPPVRNLRAAGAIILGKANLNEFGWALPNEQDLKPTPFNAWNPRYAAVGSSSGSGAAAAAGLCTAAIGTDGGGSTRLPAGQSNLIGLKATHGRISRYGQDSSTISEICPLTRTVMDTAILLNEMVSYEPDDPQSSPMPAPDYAAELETVVTGWRVGVPRAYIESAPLEPSIRQAFEDALQVLAQLGLEVVDVPIRGLAEARAANFVALNGETFVKHQRSLRETPELYGRSAYLYHLQGAFVSAADYVAAKIMGTKVREIVSRTLRENHLRALVMPTTAFVTAEAARRPGQHGKGVNASFTAPFNLTGHPALSMPAGFDAETGIPIGVQLVGANYDELSLLQLAAAYERTTDWHTRHPHYEALVAYQR
jgi:aspartyl-tRNA(Asn)/glutamyl-tRNA(Gln) amidotransferase subunit A